MVSAKNITGVVRMIILASSSPRRRELLKTIGLEFTIVSPEVEEKIDKSKKPEEIAIEIARKKAQAVEQKIGKGDIIISADTIVVYRNFVLGKPNDEKDAFNMLRKLSGKWHKVFTGVCVKTSEGELTFYEVTKVKFRKLNDAEIIYYVNTKEPLDKAGAYGIQGLGGAFVEKIVGDYTNVVGLPLPKLWKILFDRGIVGRNGT